MDRIVILKSRLRSSPMQCNQTGLGEPIGWWIIFLHAAVTVPAAEPDSNNWPSFFAFFPCGFLGDAECSLMMSGQLSNCNPFPS